jgi:hypothetical protein
MYGEHGKIHQFNMHGWFMKRDIPSEWNKPREK